MNTLINITHYLHIMKYKSIKLITYIYNITLYLTRYYIYKVHALDLYAMVFSVS